MKSGCFVGVDRDKIPACASFGDDLFPILRRRGQEAAHRKLIPDEVVAREQAVAAGQFWPVASKDNLRKCWRWM